MVVVVIEIVVNLLLLLVPPFLELGVWRSRHGGGERKLESLASMAEN